MSKEPLVIDSIISESKGSVEKSFSKIVAIIIIEAKAILREPSSIFFIFILPLVLTVVFGSVFGNDVIDEIKGIKGIDTIFPVNIVFIIANIGLMGIPISISELREKGTLKRYFSYPISYLDYFLSVMCTYLVVSGLSSILVISTCFLFFKATFFMSVSQTLAFLFFWILSIYVFYSLGYVMVLLFKSSRSTNIAATVIFLIMVFGSGVAIPLETLPRVIQNTARLTPMAHSIELMESLWTSSFFLSDNVINVSYLVVMSAMLTLIISKYKINWEA